MASVIIRLDNLRRINFVGDVYIRFHDLVGLARGDL